MYLVRLELPDRPAPPEDMFVDASHPTVDADRLMLDVMRAPREP